MFIEINGTVSKITITRFTAGEINVVVDVPELTNLEKVNAEIIFKPEPLSLFEELFTLQLVCEALRNKIKNLHLQVKIPYLYFSRYDRHMVDSDSFGLKVFMNVLNSCQIDTLVTYDAHSNVAADLFNGEFINIEQDTLLKNQIKETPAIFFEDNKPKYDFIIAPDKGAAKKAIAVGKAVGLSVIQANKDRDPTDGKIVGMSVQNVDRIQGKNCLIVDDLCDGGRTFIELAKVLKAGGANELGLYVTHGIFSKGFQESELDSYFDHIHYHHSVPYLSSTK